MSTLILLLPRPAANTGSRYEYVLSPDGHAVAAHAIASPDTFPAAGDTVAVVPAQALSWHRVTLPKGVGPGSQRLRAVLQGLLEERVLDEPQTLHLAVQPQAAAGATVWVAVCDKAWLQAHLQALEAAGHRVSRLVPECTPDEPGLHLRMRGEAGQAELLLSGADFDGGVARIEPSIDLLTSVLGSRDLPAQARLLAEPAAAALAGELLQRPAELLPRPQHLVQASWTAWNLAQFDLADRRGTRWARQVTTVAHAFTHGPSWRAARWGVAILLLAQLVGLNAWAWQERAHWQQRENTLRETLTRLFPGVRVVVDAPVQMAREVALLRQATGTLSDRDFEPLLAALGTALDAGPPVTGIDFAPGEARIRGLPTGANDLVQLNARLRPLGYGARADGAHVLVQTLPTP